MKLGAAKVKKRWWEEESIGEGYGRSVRMVQQLSSVSKEFNLSIVIEEKFNTRECFLRVDFLDICHFPAIEGSEAVGGVVRCTTVYFQD
jgi:hypothetical protein